MYLVVYFYTNGMVIVADSIHYIKADFEICLRLFKALLICSWLIQWSDIGYSDMHMLTASQMYRLVHPMIPC